MITVACVLFNGGKRVPAFSRCFDPTWVDKLYRGVARNLSAPFQFICATDRDYTFEERGIRQRALQHFRQDRLALLECLRFPGLVWMTGLDTVITGSLDFLAEFDPGPEGLGMLRDPNRPQDPCSGWCAWRDRKGLYEAARAHPFKDDVEMRWLGQRCTDFLDDRFPGKFVSYKCHVKRDAAVLDEAAVVYFHGREKPHEVDEAFVAEHWR